MVGFDFALLPGGVVLVVSSPAASVEKYVANQHSFFIRLFLSLLYTYLRAGGHSVTQSQTPTLTHSLRHYVRRSTEKGENYLSRSSKLGHAVEPAESSLNDRSGSAQKNKQQQPYFIPGTTLFLLYLLLLFSPSPSVPPLPLYLFSLLTSLSPSISECLRLLFYVLKPTLYE